METHTMVTVSTCHLTLRELSSLGRTDQTPWMSEYGAIFYIFPDTEHRPDPDRWPGLRACIDYAAEHGSFLRVDRDGPEVPELPYYYK